MSRELSMTYLPVDQLTPYKGNTRKHEQYDVETIANSIRKFGFNDPIGVWGEQNIVVEGHGRLLAAKELGIAEVPVIRLDHMTAAERRAYAIAHNKSAEQSSWDIPALKDELKDLTDDFDMTDFGFGDFELTVLLDDIDPVPYDAEETKEYDANEAKYLAKKRVIITYTEDTEPFVCKLLGVEEIKKVVYDISEVHNE